MAEQIEKLAQFVAETQWEDIPRAVQQHAKLVLLDTFGVILAGAEQPEVRRLQEGLKASAGTGATVFTRGWPTTDAGRAALLNGIAGRSIELCEGHVEVSSQAAVQIVPGALAVAEAARSTGREMLTALIVGYDFADTRGRGDDPAPAGAPERPGGVAGRYRRGRPLARAERRRHEHRGAHRRQPDGDRELWQRRGRRDDAQRRRRDERSRGDAGP